MYGRKYLDSMINLFRKEAEDCDNLESFLMVFSMGGGKFILIIKLEYTTAIRKINF